VSSPAHSVRRPSYLAELGRWRLLSGAPSEAGTLQPLYLRRARPVQ
jgi:hypothetical protein